MSRFPIKADWLGQSNLILLLASVAKDYHPSFLRGYRAKGLSKICAVCGWGAVQKCEESLDPINCVEEVRYRWVDVPGLQKEGSSR